MTEKITIDDIIEEFEELTEWTDRCDYLIDLGFDLPELPEQARAKANRVQGCQSNVWSISDVEQADPPLIILHAKSDSIIVSGLTVVSLALYSGKAPTEIIAIDPKSAFQNLGLDRFLSPQRRNGLHGMVRRVQELPAKMKSLSSAI